MAIFTTLDEVQVYGGITHGAEHTVYDDNEIKTLVGKKAGAYGCHWVYGDINLRNGVPFDECNILVVSGNEKADEVVFAGRSGLKDCLEFLGQFAAQ